MGRVRYCVLKADMAAERGSGEAREAAETTSNFKQGVYAEVCGAYAVNFLFKGSMRRSVSLITPTFTCSSTGLGTYSKTPGAT